MVREAEEAGELGMVFMHFKNDPYETDYVIFKAEHFLRFLGWAKEGAAQERE